MMIFLHTLQPFDESFLCDLHNLQAFVFDGDDGFGIRFSPLYRPRNCACATRRLVQTGHGRACPGTPSCRFRGAVQEKRAVGTGRKLPLPRFGIRFSPLYRPRNCACALRRLVRTGQGRTDIETLSYQVLSLGQKKRAVGSDRKRLNQVLKPN